MSPVRWSWGRAGEDFSSLPQSSPVQLCQYTTRGLIRQAHILWGTSEDTKRQGKTHSHVVPSRELSGSTHPNFRQTHRARYKRLIIGCGRPATMEAKYAGSSRLSLGGALARAEA